MVYSIISVIISLSWELVLFGIGIEKSLSHLYCIIILSTVAFNVKIKGDGVNENSQLN